MHLSDSGNRSIRNKMFCPLAKSQIKPKGDWRAVDSPKKRTNEFVLFAVKSIKADKTNSLVCFLGESTARQSAFGFI